MNRLIKVALTFLAGLAVVLVAVALLVAVAVAVIIFGVWGAR